MAKMNFGGVIEEVMTREEFPLEKAREILKDEQIAVIGYGVQGPGQACNLRDNGFNVIVGQRQGKTFEKAIADGWVPGETLFSIEEAAEKASIVMCLLSDAAVMSVWPTLKKYLIYDNGASLKGKGINFTRKRLLKHLRSFYSKNKSNDG